MNKKYFSWKLLNAGICIMFLTKCKIPYNPPIQASNSQLLVVEGYINGNGVTTMKLSRTRNITWGDTAAYKNELNANVVVEDKNNNTFILNETGGGFYSGNTFLNPGNLYRLHIRTANQKEYVSDFVPYKQSPPIDTIGWNFKDGGVQIYANTHDPQNNTRYYRWSYEETWEFHSAYNSNIKFDPADSSVVFRTEQVDTCWQSRNSNTIFLGASAKLQDDIIDQAQLAFLPFGDKRLSVLYSTLVTQYALDSSAYNYWLAMKSNTENVGSIFDPQPNQTKGNIHCVTDSSEIVIGYIGAGVTEQQRIFISNNAMPPDWNSAPNCDQIEVPTKPKDTLYYYFHIRDYIPISKDTPDPYPNIVRGYFASYGLCVDCTLGGTNIKPTFWP